MAVSTPTTSTALPSPLSELTSSQLGFVGNAICPFCQRVQILLNDAQLAHARVDLDFTDKPAWFTELAPLGKVPLLIDGQSTIFGSGPILEYLNQLAGGRYLPPQAKAQACMRSWSQSIDAIHDEVRKYFTTAEPASFEAAQQRVASLLDILGSKCPAEFLEPRPLSLLTVCLSALFVLIDALEVYPKPLVPEGSALASLKTSLLELAPVRAADTSESRVRLLSFIGARASVFSSHERVQSRLRNLPELTTEKNAQRYLAQR